MRTESRGVTDHAFSTSHSGRHCGDRRSRCPGSVPEHSQAAIDRPIDSPADRRRAGSGEPPDQGLRSPVGGPAGNCLRGRCRRPREVGARGRRALRRALEPGADVRRAPRCEAGRAARANRRKQSQDLQLSPCDERFRGASHAEGSRKAPQGQVGPEGLGRPPDAARHQQHPDIPRPQQPGQRVCGRSAICAAGASSSA